MYLLRFKVDQDMVKGPNIMREVQDFTEGVEVKLNN